MQAISLKASGLPMIKGQTLAQGDFFSLMQIFPMLQYSSISIGAIIKKMKKIKEREKKIKRKIMVVL